MLKDRKQDFIIERLKREQYFNMRHSHFHPYYEIYYLLSGRRKFFLNDTLYTMEKGDMILIKRGELHRTTYITDEIHERLSIHFTESYLKSLFSTFTKPVIMECFKNPLITIPVNRRPYIEDLFQKIMAESRQTDLYSAYLKQLYFEEFILFLLRYQKYFEAASIHPEMQDAMIQKTVKYIRRHYSQDITLSEAASHANMTPTYFSKKFKRITGFGFKEYVSKIRISEASHLLLETNSSITQIASSCGFNDSNYFGDVFKKERGISPTQYRKSQEFI